MVKDNLTVDAVHKLLFDLVPKINMELMKGIPINPTAGFEEGVNGGCTGVAIITTSHMVLHTWNASKDFQFDLYSCKEFDREIVVDHLYDYGLIAHEQKFFDRKYKIIDEINHK